MTEVPTTPPVNYDYKQALDGAKRELTFAIAELGEAQNRALELEQRIVDLRQTVSVLSKLCGEAEIDVEDSLGLTDAIRAVFVNVGKTDSASAQDIRLRLEGQGFNTRRYGNLLASIHTVIKRLEAKQEIKHAGTKVDRPAYTITDSGIAVAFAKGIGSIINALLNAPAQKKR